MTPSEGMRMAAHGRATEAPLVVGDDSMGRPAEPPRDPDASASRTWGPGILVWLVMGLGLGLVAVAIAGISLRPPASDDGLEQVAADPFASVASQDDPPADTVATTTGRRQTVTVWTLPSGVSTWWPLGSHVVFMSDGQDQAGPRVFVHDKLSGRATWSTDVAAGQVVVVRDPDNGDSVRFTVPGAVVGATPGLDGEASNDEGDESSGEGGDEVVVGAGTRVVGAGWLPAGRHRLTSAW